MAAQQPIRASRVDMALGVQTDLTTGNWTSISAMVAQAQFVGAETIRVFVPTLGNWTAPYRYTDQVAEAGLKLDLIADTSDTPANNAAAIARFVAAHPGSVVLVEGPNEPNNWGVDYAGLHGIDGALAWQVDFYTAMKANPVTAAITIAGVSSWPYVAAASDQNNIHIYPANGDQPANALATTILQQTAADPGKSFVITELGWSTLAGVSAPNAHMTGVDQATQAKFLLNAYMDAASAGATHIGLYNLRDWAGGDFGAHFGLFFRDDTPKPAAVALNIVQSILSDTGPDADSFKLGSLNYSLIAPADVRSLLMQKSTGEFVIALWREPDIWDETLGQAIGVVSQTVSLKLAGTANAAVYDPLVGRTAISLATATGNLTLNVTDHPIFVTLSDVRALPETGSTAGANLLVNGSFEDGPRLGQFTALGAGSTAIDGWTVTNGSIDDIHSFWRAADGNNSLDMNGDRSGTIAQTFTTTIGTQYLVRFSLAANPDDQNVHGLRVSAAAEAQDFFASGVGHDHDDMGWADQVFTFTANGTSTTLQFTGLDFSYWGAALDNVSVVAATAGSGLSTTVPTPAPTPLPTPAPVAQGNANLLVNGSFEDGPRLGQFTALGAGSTAIDGWTVTNGSIDDIHSFWRAADGNNSLDMNGDRSGTIAQTFATTIGTQYLVRFSLAANPDDQNVHGLRVSAAAEAQDFFASGVGHDHDDMGWADQVFTFTANGTSTTLQFTGLDSSYWGAALDNVSVVAAVGLGM